MTINDKALEADLLRALDLEQEETIKALHLQGADLIAGVLHSPSKLWYYSCAWTSLNKSRSNKGSFLVCNTKRQRQDI